MAGKRKYSDEELLSILTNVLIENPNITQQQFKEMKNYPDVMVYIKRFGSWNNAKKLTGVTNKICIGSYTDEELLEILKMELDKNPNVPQSYFKNENGLPNGRSYHARFGSWNNAKKMAGSKDLKVYNYTDKELIDMLREELIKNPRLRQIDLDKIDGVPHSRTYGARFGWNEAKKLTGVLFDNLSQKQTDDELLNILKKELNKNPNLTIVDFNKIENTPSYSTYIDRFGSWNEAKILCKADIIFSKKFTDEEMLECLRDYNEKYGFPETVGFNDKKEYPCFQMYYLRFGSWENALNLAGIEIPKEKEKYYNARNYTKEEILEEVQILIDSYLEDNIFLPPKSYFSKKSKKISDATLNKMFGGIYKTYELLGYDYKEFNKKRLEEDMIEKYKEIKEILQHVPSINEIKEFSKKHPEFYASTTYRRHFGSLPELQLDLFGQTTEIKKSCITPNGTQCLSSLEYIVAIILENNKYSFDKDVLYKKFINLKSKHSVDFVVYKNDKYYFIEVFGLMNYEDYAEKARWKIQLCKDNNIPLLELYPKDISMSQFDELANTIANFVNQ